jgi:hypothetical protein
MQDRGRRIVSLLVTHNFINNGNGTSLALTSPSGSAPLFFNSTKKKWRGFADKNQPTQLKNFTHVYLKSNCK